jgi:hypothetical protein
MKSNVNNVSKQLVPYRESNLTKILQESFYNNNLITMLTCIYFSFSDFEENFRVLNFANLTGKINTQKSKVFSSENNNNKYLLSGRLNPEFYNNTAGNSNGNNSKGINGFNLSLISNGNLNNNNNSKSSFKSNCEFKYNDLNELNENENDNSNFNNDISNYDNFNGIKNNEIENTYIIKEENKCK